MRLWHYELLPYLPELQFEGQLRELVAIMKDLKYKKQTNHILINKVMEYDKVELLRYFDAYCKEYSYRYSREVSEAIQDDFWDFSGVCAIFFKEGIFENWHNKEYLRVCMANLYEKHKFDVGKSRITDEEWQTLLNGYKQITGEDYVI